MFLSRLSPQGADEPESPRRATLTTPVQPVLSLCSAEKIWTKKEHRWLLFKWHVVRSDLYDLEDGQTYWITVPYAITLRWLGREWPLVPGENRIVWRDRAEWVSYPGATIDEVWLEWAEFTIKRLGFDRLLSLAGIRKVEVLSPTHFATKFPYATGSAYSGNGVITFKDFPILPASAFIDIIIHEAWHEIQVILGFFDGQNKNEWQAYAMSQLVELLYGSTLNVFKDAVYAPAVALAQKSWD